MLKIFLNIQYANGISQSLIKLIYVEDTK
jgi:hypothetical protein